MYFESTFIIKLIHTLIIYNSNTKQSDVEASVSVLLLEYRFHLLLYHCFNGQKKFKGINIFKKFITVYTF